MKRYSQFINDLTEKALSNNDLEDLIKRARKAAQGVEDDDTKSTEEKNRASEVLGWIDDVEQTFRDENKLHPNSVTALFRIVAGVGSGRYGRSNPPDGRVPKDFRR